MQFYSWSQEIERVLIFINFRNLSLKGNNMKLSKLAKLLTATAAFAISASSHASLVLIGPITDTGTGIGAVNTVLTLQNDNQTGTTSGAVVRTASGDATTGNTQPGSSHNATYSFGQLNITSASDLQFVFNPVEPGQTLANSVTLETMVLTIYTDAGAILFTAGLDHSYTFPETETGTGQSGFLFGLDGPQALAAQAFVSSTNRIGLAASLSSATGGPDTFFVSVLGGEGPGNQVPEPGTVALLGLGIAGLTAMRRRQRKA
jgi:hypothetical protein